MDATANPFVRTSVDIEHQPRRPSAVSIIQQPGQHDLRKRSVAESSADPKQHVPTHVFEIEEPVEEVDLEDNFPEGGLKAWSVVAGAFLILFTSFGMQVSIGTLQDYWFQNQLLGYSALDVGWIPAMFVYLGLALGLIVGPLFDRYGPKYIVPIGTTSYVIMIFLLAECSTYWQLMLCCGVYGGICAAFLTTTGLATVSHWFKARRGLAHGISMIGSSFGGLTIPLILRATLPRYGYKWSIRILGFIFLVCCIGANLLLKARIPPKRVKKRSIISLGIFRDARVSFLAISTFGIEIVLFGALGILPTYASVGTNFAPDTGFYLISVLNGSSCLGRLIPGYLADKMGRFNVFSIAMVFTLVVMLVIWLPFGATSLPALYIFASAFGFATGSWMALLPACIGQLCRADQFGTFYGSLYFAAGTSLLITIPISGAIIETAGPKVLVLFYCAVLAVSTVTFVTSRWACLDWKWSWRAKI